MQRHQRCSHTKPPSARELGIEGEHTKRESALWPLHVKNVGVINWDAITGMTHDEQLSAALNESWLTSSKHYGVTWPEMVAEQVPYSRFTNEQITKMLEGGKLKPLDDKPIKCAVKGFAIPQPTKKRLRPVFEPMNNDRIDRKHLPPLTYPSRRERRSTIARKKYFMEFDFSAWYDQ